MPHYYDAHLHLQDKRLLGVSEQTQLFKNAGIRCMVINSTCESDWETVARLGAFSPYRPAFGLHPWMIKHRSPKWFENLQRQIDASPQALIGEIGLDKWIRNPQLADQIKIFEKQLDLAIERRIPPTIHCLKAWGTLLDILKARRSISSGFLLHSYAGPAEMVEDFVQLGAWFSFSGYFAHPEKSAKLNAWKQIPLDRILIETDAPDMCPPESLIQQTLKDAEGRQINHPLNLIKIYGWLANHLNMSDEDFQKQIEGNFLSLFG